MSIAETLWQKAKELLRQRLDDWQFDNWIEPLVPLKAGEGTISLEVPNRYSLDWLADNYLADIRAAVSEADGRQRDVTFVVSKTPTPNPESFATPSGPVKGPTKGARASVSHPSLEASYTFATFVVGKSNSFAHAGAVHVADHPGTGYNPLFIYSTPGLGKTHLMQAIGQAIYAKDSSKSVIYITAEEFLNDMIAHITRKRMDEFRRRYRRADVLLIDDVQFFAGKEGVIEEIFHTFNTLLDAKRQIVMTSDRYPKQIQNMDRRLVSRFEMGLVADIQPPEFETRLAILRQHAETQRTSLPDDVATFLASNFSTDVREMKGAANRLLVFSSLNGIPISIDLAKEVLRNLLDHRHRNLSPEEIVKQAARDLGVKIADLKSKRKSRDIAEPRQIIMHLLRRTSDLSLPAIGQLFGGRDHTTVLHAIRKVDERMASDPAFRVRVDSILRGFHRG